MFNSFIEFLHRSKKTVLLIIIVATITMILATIISLAGEHYVISNLGTIRTSGVKAYGGDITLKVEKQRIDWGTIYPGTFTNRSFYIKSQSNIKTTLNLTTASWTFQDSQGKNVTESLATYNIKREQAMNLTWNYTGALVSPGEEIHVTLTLWASNDISFINYLISKKVQGFSFDIHIYAEE